MINIMSIIEKDFVYFKKQIIFTEWNSLLKKIQKHDNQISSIRNWCILTLTGIIGFILTQISSNSLKMGYGILCLPLFVVFFFALNEGIVQLWKWEAIERLYDIDKILRKYNSLNSKLFCLFKINLNEMTLLNYEPSLISHLTRQKLDKEKTSQSWFDKSDVRRNIKNTLLAVNFIVFYGLLFLSNLIFVIFFLITKFNYSNLIILILIIFVLIIIVGLVFWYYFSFIKL
jgi:hypothetical protein